MARRDPGRPRRPARPVGWSRFRSGGGCRAACSARSTRPLVGTSLRARAAPARPRPPRRRRAGPRWRRLAHASAPATQEPTSTAGRQVRRAIRQLRDAAGRALPRRPAPPGPGRARSRDLLAPAPEPRPDDRRSTSNPASTSAATPRRCFYRTAHEALRNVAAHAAAHDPSRVTRRRHDAIEVTDDGQGLTPPADDAPAPRPADARRPRARARRRARDPLDAGPRNDASC